MPENFLILGTQRTGSQALFNALNLHPDVICGGEWIQRTAWYRKVAMSKRALAGDFNDLISWRPWEQEWIGKKLTPRTGWLGFKILFRSSDKWIGHPRFAPAINLDRLEGHLRWLRRRPDIHIIHLVRRDTLEWLKSKYISRHTGIHGNKAYPEGVKITIPISSALRAAAAKAWVDARLASLALSNPYHLVNYEDFNADNKKELASCLAFLNCDLQKLPGEGASPKKRQSKGSASEYIQNYDDLILALEARGALASRSSHESRGNA